MATKVYMEALSPTMEEGRLVSWSKQEGDPVATGDTLAEVETDKAIMELVARADGQLIKVLVAEGETVPVGSVVAYIGEAGEQVAEAPSRAEPVPAAATTALRPETPVAATVSPEPTPTLSTTEPGRLRASPLARRMAKDAGVDLKLVAGSGPGGRVVKRDLEEAVARPSPRPTAAPVAAVPGERRDVPYEDIPLSQIRKTIAKRLTASLGPVPHFFLTVEADMERAAEAREALNRQLGDRGKVSFNDIIIKATALALTRHRACNAWFQEGSIRYWNDVHVGVAVAVEEGLITPVLRHADRKSLLQIATELRSLAERARQRRLTPDEYTGSTFSVSNLGMFDIDQFTGVINPPEAAILAVGRIAAKPVAAEGTVTIRRRVRLTMSCDHRVIDGATGAAFLQTLTHMLENPLAML